MGETIKQLKGFQYAPILDLNMGYYTMRLFTASKDMKLIVTGFGKFRYNSIPMGMCASGDIFQAKIEKLLSYIEGVRTYSTKKYY